MKKILSLLFTLLLIVSFNANSQTNGSFKSVRFYNVPDSAAFLATTWANFIAAYPQSGGLYYNEQSSKFRVYQNGVWSDLGVGGGTGNISGTLTSPRIPFASSSSGLSDDSNLSWDNTNKRINLNGSTIQLRDPAKSVFIGQSVGNNTSTGLDNIFIGNDIGTGITTANDNIAIGRQAGKNMNVSSAHYNVFIGALAGVNTSGASENVGIGYRAIQQTSGEDNIGIGFGPGMQTTAGRNNIFMGYYAGAPTGAGVVRTDYTNASGSLFIGPYVSTDNATESGQINIQNVLFSRNNSGTNPPAYPETGNAGFFISSPTARLHLPAGSATANKASLKINPGTLLATPENGAIENDGSFLYYTNSGGTRFALGSGTGDMVLASAQTSTGKKTFSNSVATIPGFNVGSFAADPTTLSNGDMWHNSAVNNIGVRIGGGTYRLSHISQSDALVNRVPFLADNSTGRMASTGGFTATSTVVTTPRLFTTSTTTLPGLHVGVVASLPATRTTGDMWTQTAYLRAVNNAIDSYIMTTDTQPGAGYIPFGATSNTYENKATIAFTKASNTLTVGDVAGVGTITVQDVSNNASFQGAGITGSNQFGITASSGNVGLNPSTGIVTINSDPLQGGLYTPTATNVANVTSSTVSDLHYMRINDEVTISGKVDLTYTAATTVTTLYLTLPYASNFTNVNDLQGTVLEYNESLQTVIEGNVANDRLELRFASGAVGGVACTLRFTCMYTVK